jgi:flavin-dependent dehydrogenase
MMHRRYDVVVVGGGPAGSTAARICAESGLKTLLVEEQAHIGYPVQCAGLLSCNAFSECEVSKSSVMNTVSGADVHAGTATCSFDAGKTMAYVVDRAALDQEMARRAADAGADIRLKTIASGISRRSKTLRVKGIYGTKEVEYSMVIAADGPRSTISRMVGIPRAPFISQVCSVMSSIRFPSIMSRYIRMRPQIFLDGLFLFILDELVLGCVGCSRFKSDLKGLFAPIMHNQFTR